LRKYNDSIPIDGHFEHELREFFDFRWKHDMNLSLSDPDDMQLYDQLEESVQRQIQMFLYHPFVKHYRRYFNLRDYGSKHDPAFFTDMNPDFSDFMQLILSHLEP
jgi:hypothetical protein